MQVSFKFLGHIIDGNGVSVDPSKVEAIAKLSKAALMEEYVCKPLFSLTAGQKRRTKIKTKAKAGTY